VPRAQSDERGNYKAIAGSAIGPIGLSTVAEPAGTALVGDKDLKESIKYTDFMRSEFSILNIRLSPIQLQIADSG
jgi:hypothetical protein